MRLWNRSNPNLWFPMNEQSPAAQKGSVGNSCGLWFCYVIPPFTNQSAIISLICAGKVISKLIELRTALIEKQSIIKEKEKENKKPNNVLSPWSFYVSNQQMHVIYLWFSTSIQSKLQRLISYVSTFFYSGCTKHVLYQWFLYVSTINEWQCLICQWFAACF